VATTVLRKLKRSGNYYRWPAYEVEVDHFGRWLFSPAGTVFWGHPANGPRVEWEVGRGAGAAHGVSELWLVPTNEWWAAKWCESGGSRGISIDVCTPPELIAGDWTFRDLELDPWWDAKRGTGIADEDEFLEASEAGAISASERAAARATADELLEKLQKGTAPFGRVGWERFEAAGALGLAPLRG
jgi:hypothetical protein